MQFSFRALLSTAAVLAGVASAAFPNTTQEFYLKTKLISGATKFDGLYTYSYHTGAGLGDATLISDKSVATKNWFNDTSLNAQVSGNDYVWGWQPIVADYVAWNPVQINSLGPGQVDFFVLNGSRLTAPSMGAPSWLACDWSHGVPQLYYYSSEYYGTPPTSNCAQVDLVQELI